MRGNGNSKICLQKLVHRKFIITMCRDWYGSLGQNPSTPCLHVRWPQLQNKTGIDTFNFPNLLTDVPLKTIQIENWIWNVPQLTWHQLALSNIVWDMCTILYPSFLFGAPVQFLHTVFEIGYIFHLSKICWATAYILNTIQKLYNQQ